MPSCEILVKEIDLNYHKINPHSFCLRLTSPPQSYREPSLWQNDFNMKYGILFHIGGWEYQKEEECFYSNGLFDDFRNIRFTFEKKVWKELKTLITYLIKNSKNKQITFTTDYQFGPKKFTYKPMKLKNFIKLHDQKGIRFNSWIDLIE